MLPPGQRSAPEGVIVGTEFADDAAVVRLQEDDERCLVLTTDVIAPIAVMVQPEPLRVSLAMIWAVCDPLPVRS